MEDRPVRIGITTSFEAGEQRLRREYVLAVERAGGLPIPVPMAASRATVLAVIALLDGLVMTGGPAVTQGIVGELPDDIDETDPVRRDTDRWALEAAAAARIPVLGICYGMQLPNALAGGSIYADVERQRGAGVHSEKRGGSDHAVRIEPGTHLRELLATDVITVNTRHIQAVAEPGSGMRVAARADDGVIEAVESTDGRFIGVQFHPERMGPAGDPLFTDLIRRAYARREQSAPIGA
jgi:putative glutamine amidotransferase